MLRAPLRDVVALYDIEGPRGGTIWVMRFSCGHWEWNRRRHVRPPQHRRCTTCWVEHKLKEVHDGSDT